MSNPAVLQNFVISIHALREEGDAIIDSIKAYAKQFLSTPSARRATLADLRHNRCNGNFYPRPPRGGRHAAAKTYSDFKRISIHALREEGDTASKRASKWQSNFYPRPPRGGRLPFSPNTSG